MVTAMAVSAPKNKDVQPWDQIQWAQCERIVKKLQMRIVKAIKQGRWGRVKALQRLIVTSFSGKALAVKRVTESKGRRTPGIDKQLWSKPGSKTKAVLTLKRRGYAPSPLRRVYIAKANGQRDDLWGFLQ